MKFKTCIAEFIEEQEDDMCFYIRLSDAIRGKDKEGNIVFFEHLVILERTINDNIHTVVMGSYDDSYTDINPIPIIPEVINGKDVESVLNDLGYGIQVEYI